jgi:hypothetical protein
MHNMGIPGNSSGVCSEALKACMSISLHFPLELDNVFILNAMSSLLSSYPLLRAISAHLINPTFRDFHQFPFSWSGLKLIEMYLSAQSAFMCSFAQSVDFSPKCGTLLEVLWYGWSGVGIFLFVTFYFLAMLVYYMLVVTRWFQDGRTVCELWVSC